jgi:DNA-binding response OmpR family regulator
MRVLVIEDDRIIGDGVVAGLDLEGYAVDWVEDIESAETAIDANKYDLMVLDIGLPDGSGLDFLKGLRTSKNDTPVIILTAYDDVSFKVKGLDTGADDYLIKPFKLEELTARLRALYRRREGRVDPILQSGSISLDPAAKTVFKGEEKINLGPKEFIILHTLMERRGKVMSKAQIEDGLYGWDAEVESNTIEVHIHGLRKKLGKEAIETIKYVGYRLNENF